MAVGFRGARGPPAAGVVLAPMVLAEGTGSPMDRRIPLVSVFSTLYLVGMSESKQQVRREDMGASVPVRVSAADWRALVRQGYASVGADGVKRALTYNPATGGTELVPVRVVRSLRGAS